MVGTGTDTLRVQERAPLTGEHLKKGLGEDGAGVGAPVGGSGAPSPWPYLLVHGSMDRATSFRRLASRLPEATVISYDRRGYAGSSARAPTEVFADHVDDLLEVLDGRAVVALGHSYGANVVLAAAQRHPELIRAAVVWEAPMPWLPWWPATTAGAAVIADEGDHADVAEAFMRRMVTDRIWERLPATTRRARREEGSALIAEMRALGGEAPWEAAAITIPVIVGAGQKSRAHQRRAAVELAAALPNAELVTLPEARHGAHLTHPVELAALLRRAALRAAANPASAEGGAANPAPAVGGDLGVAGRAEASSSGPGAPTPADEESPA